MTESQAKEKWCPMFQGWVNGKGDEHYKCKGSACMMWRPQSVYVPSVNARDESKPIDGGYCGLAGKP